MLFKIGKPAGEAAADDLFWNVVPALPNALHHPFDGRFDIGQAQEIEADPVTLRAPFGDVAQVGQAGQGGFKGEALPARRAQVDFLQHQAPGAECGGFGGEGG